MHNVLAINTWYLWVDIVLNYPALLDRDEFTRALHLQYNSEFSFVNYFTTLHFIYLASEI